MTYFEHKKITDFNINADGFIEDLTEAVSGWLTPKRRLHYLIFDGMGWRVSSEKPRLYKHNMHGPYASDVICETFETIWEDRNPYSDGSDNTIANRLQKSMYHIYKTCTDKKIYVIDLSCKKNSGSTLSERIKMDLSEIDSTIDGLRKENEVLKSKMDVNDEEINRLEYIKDRLGRM